jgi:glycosyltransferase involved in cell wall biosynthesis
MREVPTVTVVVPTKNRPQHLADCLESLARQEYPRGSWRLVVVNDGGSDPSAVLPAPLQDTLPLTLIQSPASGPAAARNRGASAARTDLLMFLDDDCRADPAWVREMAEGISASPYHACMGRMLNGNPGRWPARAYQYFMAFYRDYARMPNGDLYLVMSNNAVYRRDAFAELGGFCEDFLHPGAEDLELSHRLAAHGLRQGYLPRAVLYHAHCATAAAYLRQQYQYGRGYAQMKMVLGRKGIPMRVGQRRRPQFHLELLRAMANGGPGVRAGALIGCGILAHSLGMRVRFSPAPFGAPPSTGDSE